MKLPAKIIQISTQQNMIFALLEDGTLWRKPYRLNWKYPNGCDVEDWPWTLVEDK